MLKHVPFALAGLVAIVGWGVGGYEPWSMFLLEVAAFLLAVAIVVTVLFGTTREERQRNVSFARSQRRAFFGRTSREVEITPPSDGANAGAHPGIDRVYVLGYPFRRTGVGVLALAMTAWMTLSLVPVPVSWLSVVSPTAHTLRAEIQTILGGNALEPAPWSVTPFLSYQDVLLWLAYLMIFWTTYHVAASSRAVRRLTLAIVAVGIASGAYGLIQWLSLIGASLNDGSSPSGIMATGTFGNRNHYAFFQEIALLTGLGWLSLHWNDAARRARNRVSRQEARARTSLFALGVGCIGLSLLFSLSRSGITFAVAGVAALFFMSRRRSHDNDRGRNTRPILSGFALCLVAAALWIGIDPVLTRFELVPHEITSEDDGRAAVWRDSLGAVEDFWLTGSGLSSFQYVFPIYRTFGGRRFYSWAHNDYLQVTIELGLPGLLLTGFIILWIVRRAHRVRLDISAQPGWSHLHAGYCAAAIAGALHSLTDFGLHLPANALLFSIVVGVITGMAPDRHSRRRDKTRKKKLRRSPPAFA